MAATSLLIDTHARIESREDYYDTAGTYWAAILDQFGITVYAMTEEKVRERCNNALAFLVQNYISESGVEKLREYLDRHDVKYSLIEESEGASPVSFSVSFY